MSDPPIPFAPYYSDEAVTIYNGDCLRIVPWLSRFDLLLTDPPYGKNIAKTGNFGVSGGKAKMKSYQQSDWDVFAMNAGQWHVIKAATENQIVFGYQYMASILGESNTPIVWDKKTIDGWEDNFADCEIAYSTCTKKPRVFRYQFMGACRGANGKGEVKVHPTQKPLALMRWCLSLVPEAKTVLDPFAGSGTTGVACKLEGRKATLIEISEEYCEKAADRLRQGVLF